MATAADIIKGALRKTGIHAAETPIEAVEIQDGLEDLNDFGSSLEASTIQLGFIPLENTSDEVNIPREAVAMYKNNLAVYIAGDYGAPIPQTLVKAAKDTMKQVLRAFQKPIDVQYPDTLPIGSGNECDFITNDDRFFPSNKKDNF